MSHSNKPFKSNVQNYKRAANHHPIHRPAPTDPDYLDYYYSCANKRVYYTRRESRTALSTMKRLYGDDYNTYVCKYCGFLHLGHRRPDREESHA